MRPVLYACYFGGETYTRMARVLAFTAARHCQGWDVRVELIDPATFPTYPLAAESHVANAQKMEAWARVVRESPDGARLLFVDADAFVVRGLDELWEAHFEVAYTVRPAHWPVPINSGVVGVQVTERSRAFIEAWRQTCLAMMRDRPFHEEWRTKRRDGKYFGGIHQAALGYLLSFPRADDVNLLPLPCHEWNCEDSSWEHFDPEITRIVHVKSALRRAIFHQPPVRLRRTDRLMGVWKALEAEALEADRVGC